MGGGRGHTLRTDRPRLLGVVSLVKRGFSNNVAALAMTQAGSAALRFGGNLVLTRLLAPEAFGVMLVVTSVAYILTMLTETGVSPFIIRAEGGDDPRRLDTLWTVSVLRGALTMTLVIIGAPLFAHAIGKPEVALPLQVASVMLLIQGCRSVAPYVALRRHEAAKNAWIELGGQVVSLPVTVGLVWATGSYWGLVFGTVLGSVVTTVATYLFYEESSRRFALDRGVFGELWRFSRFIAASSLTTVVVMQFDKMFVIASFSLAGAGLYAIASNFAMIPNLFADAYYSRVYMPLVSERLRREAPSAALFYRPMRFVRPLVVFACAGGVTFGATFVELIFPASYAEAGAFLSVLVIRPLLGALCKPTGMLLVSNQMARERFYGDCLRVLWVVAASLLGWHYYGVWGLLWAVALTELLPTIYQYAVVARLGVVRLRDEADVAVAVALGAGAGWLADGFVGMVA